MSTLSRDHKRSLISAPLQTLITAGVSFLTVYYLVRVGGVDTLGLWALGNLAVLYGAALVLGAHQKIARDFARGNRQEAITGLRSFSGGIFIVSAMVAIAVACSAFIPNLFGTFDALSIIVLVLSASFWTLGLLARGPALYLGQFSQSNLLEASSAVLAFLLTVMLTQFFGVGPMQIWLPFLARSLSLFLALVIAVRRQPEILQAFVPGIPNPSETARFLRTNAGTSALWLATSSRMVVLRTFFGAVLGPAALGLLDVAMRVPTLLVNGVSSGNQTLLVGLSAALREGESDRIISLLFGLAQILILINVPLLFGYAAYADVMFHILVGTDIEQLTLLTWLTTAWVGVTAINQITFWIVQ
ncbi:MAG: hypothetical protein SXG53_28995, partial [Pseudomonadota bacterium]|nr:hypothetical protein [Pseudomonadota bacterium]